ncbi:MAG: YqeG family HAD IIIA-type phosphatase [Clostridiales bacterium]|nr:YqeG family HAD IIIA-type phosphatase [Clostridiales bacterium]
MKKIFRPTIEVKNIDAINFESFYQQGYDNIILDIDNTIVPWNNHIADKTLHQKIIDIKEIGFNICLLSNNSSSTRVHALAEDLNILAVPKGMKPLPIGFKKALKQLDADKNTTLVIGDQIFTDVLGGNIMGMTTILVEPISKDEFIGTRFVRILERVFAGRRIEDGYRH